MTKAESLMNSGPLSITLSCVNEDDNQLKKYTASFMPDYINPLQIKDTHDENDDPYTGSAIFLSYESAVKLAEFLKDLFLDEIPDK